MAEVLGRVVTSDLECPRGPDASHRIRVPKSWLEQGATVELELPRHLTCAACDGGGCDVCERSGAVTLRGRGEPSDLVEVSLPATMVKDVFVIRIPEYGGLPATGSGLPRGHLLLRIEASADGDASVSLAIRARPVELARAAASERPVQRGWQKRAAVVGLVALATALLIWLLSTR